MFQPEVHNQNLFFNYQRHDSEQFYFIDHFVMMETVCVWTVQSQILYGSLVVGVNVELTSSTLVYLNNEFFHLCSYWRTQLQNKESHGTAMIRYKSLPQLANCWHMSMPSLSSSSVDLSYPHMSQNKLWQFVHPFLNIAILKIRHLYLYYSSNRWSLFITIPLQRFLDVFQISIRNINIENVSRFVDYEYIVIFFSLYSDKTLCLSC